MHKKLDATLDGPMSLSNETASDDDLPDNAASRSRADNAVRRKPRDVRLTCHGCGSINSAERKYCTSCGQSLWEPCLRCGVVSAAGEKFCGSCGKDLAVAFRERCASMEWQLQQIPQWCTEGRFEEAIQALAAIAETDHPRLVAYTERANQLLPQVTADLHQGQRDAEAAFQQAQARFAAYRYDEAKALMQSVPTALRTEVMNQLLSEIQSRQDEITALGNEISTLRETKATTGLLPKIERLLSLQPDDAPTRQLAQRLQNRLAQAARDKLVAYQYVQAYKLLDQVPKSIRAPDFEKLHQQASELAWMARDLASAPVIDPTLLAVGQRLRALAPSDNRTVKLVAEIERRMKVAQERFHPMPLPWVAPPAQPLLGFPVDWVTGFQRVALADDLDPSFLKQHPGRFFVAFGLALQGLAQARLRINLYPADRRRALEKLSQVMRRRTPRTAWGLDLSSSGLKAMKLSFDAGKQVARIDACEFIEHKKMLTPAMNKAEEESLLLETLQTFSKRGDITADRICLGLPGLLTLLRELRLPPMAGAKIAAAVQYETRHRLPCRPEDVAWDYQLLQQADQKAASGSENFVLLLAAQQGPLTKRLEWCEKAGLRIDMVQSDHAALYNFVDYEFLRDQPSEAPEAVAVLDVGSDTSNIAFCAPRCLWFRNIGTGGDDLTRALVQQLKLPYCEAEHLKRSPAKAGSLSKLYQAWDPVFEELIKEVHVSLDLFAKAHPECHVQRMLGVGGSFQLHGLLRQLRTGES